MLNIFGGVWKELKFCVEKVVESFEFNELLWKFIESNINFGGLVCEYLERVKEYMLVVLVN